MVSQDHSQMPIFEAIKQTPYPMPLKKKRKKKKLNSKMCITFLRYTHLFHHHSSLVPYAGKLLSQSVTIVFYYYYYYFRAPSFIALWQTKLILILPAHKESNNQVVLSKHKTCLRKERKARGGARK